MKNYSDTIGNRTHDSPTRSAVPEPTALRRAPDLYRGINEFRKGYQLATKVVKNDHFTQLFNPLKSSGFFTYHQGLTFKNSRWCPLCVDCFVRILEHTQRLLLYTSLTDWFYNRGGKCLCAVRTDSLCKADCVSSLKG